MEFLIIIFRVIENNFRLSLATRIMSTGNGAFVILQDAPMRPPARGLGLNIAPELRAYPGFRRPAAREGASASFLDQTVMAFISSNIFSITLNMFYFCLDFFHAGAIIGKNRARGAHARFLGGVPPISYERVRGGVGAAGAPRSCNTPQRNPHARRPGVLAALQYAAEVAAPYIDE